MQLSNQPTLIDIIWASGAGGTAVRPIPDTTSDPNAASFTLGWPPNTATDPTAGGDPPDWRDFNGIFKILSAWVNWMNAGGPAFYNSAFSGAVGGYPKYATLANASTVGQFWISEVDNNTSDPDTGGANWLAFPPAAAAVVNSFNTRTGAVTLTSADVVSALAANALANGKLALMPALTLKGNAVGSLSGPQDLTPAQALGVLQFTGGANVAFYPQANGSVLVRQWGTVASVASGSITPVSLPQSMTTPKGVNLTTLTTGSSTENSMAQLVSGSLGSLGFQVKMQNVAGNPSPPSQGFSWEAWGYL